MSRDLTSLRAELDALDKTLLECAARRNAIIRDIAASKASEGRPLFDRMREREVYEKTEQLAQTLGLPASIARALMGVLIESSHQIQEQASREFALSAPDGHQSFTIVGGQGQMGQLIGDALQARGHQVTALERDDEPATHSAIGASDIIVLAVPMEIATHMAEQLGPRIRADALLCDINSLKSDICDAFARTCAGEALGLHPMFGPSVHSLRRQKVVACPVQPGPKTTWLLGELGRMGMEIIESTPEQHDRMMAVIQVLVHYATIVMGEALRRTGLSVNESLRFTSPIYRLELAFIGRLFTQSPELYAEIEMANPHGPDVRKDFLEAAKDVNTLISEGNRDAFTALFDSVSTYFDDFGTEAMELSDFIIESLCTRP
jgi:chorismate mutase/prephenate dehydrogenase